MSPEAALRAIRKECEAVLGSDMNPNKGLIARIDRLAHQGLKK